jgi:hypothetical protein
MRREAATQVVKDTYQGMGQSITTERLRPCMTECIVRSNFVRTSGTRRPFVFTRGDDPMRFASRSYDRPLGLESRAADRSALVGKPLFPHCVSAISRAWQGDIR